MNQTIHRGLSKHAMRREQWLKDLKPGTDLSGLDDKRAGPSHIGDVLSVAVVLALWMVVFTA